MFTKIKITAFSLVALVLLLALNPQTSAAFVTRLFNRSLSIGSSLGGVTTSHEFSFYFPIDVNVGSISFQYCDDPLEELICNPPPGIDASAATLTSQTGETGFAIVSAVPNQLIIGRTPSVTSSQQNYYHFDNVVNPSNKGPFYVRISAYPTSDASGPEISFNSVVGAITQGIAVTSEVPDILYFCAAVLIPTDCSDASGDFIEFGTLSKSATRFGTSQFLVGTNAVNGYTVSTDGPPMTSGVNQIPGVSPPDVSRVGNPQFGLNLVANTVPLTGSDPTGAATGIIMPSYAGANHYNYIDGDIVARALSRSEEEKYTVTYIVNINSAQPSGVYNTTITYLCLASF
jgi:hypothetical protein